MKSIKLKNTFTSAVNTDKTKRSFSQIGGVFNACRCLP